MSGLDRLESRGATPKSSGDTPPSEVAKTSGLLAEAGGSEGFGKPRSEATTLAQIIRGEVASDAPIKLNTGRLLEQPEVPWRVEQDRDLVTDEWMLSNPRDPEAGRVNPLGPVGHTMALFGKAMASMGRGDMEGAGRHYQEAQNALTSHQQRKEGKTQPLGPQMGLVESVGRDIASGNVWSDAPGAGQFTTEQLQASPARVSRLLMGPAGDGYMSPEQMYDARDMLLQWAGEGRSDSEWANHNAGVLNRLVIEQQSSPGTVIPELRPHRFSKEAAAATERQRERLGAGYKAIMEEGTRGRTVSDPQAVQEAAAGKIQAEEGLQHAGPPFSFNPLPEWMGGPGYIGGGTTGPAMLPGLSIPKYSRGRGSPGAYQPVPSRTSFSGDQPGAVGGVDAPVGPLGLRVMDAPGGKWVDGQFVVQGPEAAYHTGSKPVSAEEIAEGSGLPFTPSHLK